MVKSDEAGGAMCSAAKAALTPTSATAKARTYSQHGKGAPSKLAEKSIQPIALEICRKLFEVRP
jgi:hypothetical protein